MEEHRYCSSDVTDRCVERCPPPQKGRQKEEFTSPATITLIAPFNFWSRGVSKNAIRSSKVIHVMGGARKFSNKIAKKRSGQLYILLNCPPHQKSENACWSFLARSRYLPSTDATAIRMWIGPFISNGHFGAIDR